MHLFFLQYEIYPKNLSERAKIEEIMFMNKKLVQIIKKTWRKFVSPARSDVPEHS
jgi:hypothetical protein